MPCLGAAGLAVLLLQMWLYLDAHTRMIISSVMLRSAARICVSRTRVTYNIALAAPATTTLPGPIPRREKFSEEAYPPKLHLPMKATTLALDFSDKVSQEAFFQVQNKSS